MAIAIAVGVVGVVVPVVPGILLVIAAVLAWAFVESSPTAWIVFGIAAALTVGSQVGKYALPGRRLRESGIPTRTLLVGGAVGLVAFFVIPVVGLPIGFVAGVYGMERHRLGTGAGARASTVAALKAAGLSMAIELAAALLIALLWVVGVVLT